MTPTPLSAALHHAVTEDFRNFAALIWQHLNLPELTIIQDDIALWLQHGPRRRMVKAFRGVGKSWLTAAYVLWRLYKNPNERILVISASKDRADGFTVFVRRLIAEIPWLNHLTPGSGQRDSVISFDVGGSEPHQSPSVKSAGITGQLAGSRATLIVADDIETPANSLTQMLRDRLGEQVKEFDAILLPEGEVVYLGTDQTEMSLYKQLPGRGYTVRIWPSRTPKTLKAFKSYGDQLAPIVGDLVVESGAWAPTDPVRFDEVDLQERQASYGLSGFAMQFMLDPSLGDLERFPLKAGDFIVADVQKHVGFAEIYWGSDKKQVIQDLECPGLDGDHYHRALLENLAPAPGGAPPDFTGAVMFIDPSGRGADETAYAVVKMCLGKFYWVASGGFRGGYEKSTLEGLANAAKDNSVNLILVEPNYGGGMFNKLLQPVLTRIYPCTVEDSEWSKGQKELRIIDTLEPLLNGHRLVVCRSVLQGDRAAGAGYPCGDNLRIHYRAIHQLTRLTRDRGSLRHDDRLEALAGACAYYAEQAGRDEKEALDEHLEALRDAELDKFMAECDGTVVSGPQWNKSRPLA